MAFTAKAASNLMAGDHLTVDDAPGLRLVASADRRSWTYRYKSPVDGLMRQVKIGQWPAMGLPEAMGEWHALKARRDAGGDPAAERREARKTADAEASAERFTVRMLCNEFLTRYQKRVAVKTHAEAKRLMDRELDAIADVPAATLTRRQAYSLIDGMADRPVVAAGLRQQLGAAWDEAIDAGRLLEDTPNWWRLILRGKLRSQGKKIGGASVGDGKRALTPAELAVVLPFLPNFSRDVCDVLTLYLWTACRGAETVAMERQEVTEEADGLWWTIPKAKLKMKRLPQLTDLRVPLVGRAEAVVRRRLAATDGKWLFPSRSKEGHVQQKAIGVAVWSHMPYSTTYASWVRPRLTVTEWGPHDLRRTSRTLLAALGCPDEIGEAILGHVPPGIVGVYNLHRYDEERRAWLTRLSARLEAIAVQGLATAS